MIQRPDRIALCFFSTDDQKVKLQLEQMSGIEDLYQLEIWSRADIGNAPYFSFSQLVNEAVVATDSEFMVFINPKSEVSLDAVKGIIDDLCNGFCWVGKQSFGFFGATKELYRHVGLMDEHYLGGEYEDDDFGLRLKMFGKAIKWEFDYHNYLYTDSPLGKFRGSSKSYFNTKWKQPEHDLYVFNEHLPKPKGLPLKFQTPRPDISESWLDWEHTVSDDVSHVWQRANRATFTEIPLKEVRDRATLRIKVADGKLRVEFDCETPTLISFQMALARRGGELPATTRIDLTSNKWYEQEFSKELERFPYEFRVYHDGSPVFYDRWVKVPYTNEINFGLSIYTYDL